LRTLLEDHDQLVQEIDGGVDHGEDLYVGFTRRRKRTGHVVAIQVKSGEKYRRSDGYAIPVERHFDDWRQSRVPVLGVVYDPEDKNLHWINLTKVLRSCEISPRWVQIPKDNILDAAHVRSFIAVNERYIDTMGMRVRPSDSTFSFSPPLDAPIDRGFPNPLFDPVADFISQIPLSRRQFTWGLAAIIIVFFMVFDWPYLVDFATAHGEDQPARWTINVYSLIAFLAIVVRTERKSGRFAKRVARLLGVVSINFFWLPMTKGEGLLNRWWGEAWIIFGWVAPFIIILYLTNYLILVGLERKRR